MSLLLGGNIMTDFGKRVIDVILSIPYGSVLSYKEVSELAGNGAGARTVSRILSSSSDKYSLPWWRVVNHKLEISIKDPAGRAKQIELLRSEGVQIINGKIKTL